MIKGDVFNKQYFPSNTFALFIDTFLDEECGIIADYKNGMALTNTTNQIVISSGALCVKGRFIREDSSTTLNVSYNSNTYCVLVIEIDLDKTNTISELNQVAYKILSSESDYPEPTQTDIVKNESGIYQYPLAKFTCNSSGIAQLTDLRTFLDFNSIYGEIRRHIEDIDAGTITTIPIGSGLDFYGTTPPTNFMFADGSAISRTTYSALFSIIGTTYGDGDGIETFNLPDKRERVSIMKGSNTTLGDKVGNDSHTLTKAELPNYTLYNSSHRHYTVVNANSTTRSVGTGNSISKQGYVDGHDHENYNLSGDSREPGVSRTNAVNIKVDSGGSGTAFDTRQKSFICNYIIRVK